VHYLRHVGRISECPLQLRPVSLAVLFAGDLGRLTACVVRSEAGMVAGPAAVFARAADPSLPGPLSIHLLLLPRRLLQVVLGRSARLRRRRAAEEVPRRAFLSADPPE